MPTVAVAVVSGTAPFELATAIEVFGTDRSELSPDWYDFKLCAAEPGEIRIDLIGSTALHGRSFFAVESPYEVRLRVAARVPTKEAASRVGEEVEALYTNGPAGGGGARKYVHEQVGIVSCLVPRDRALARLTLFESGS